MREKFPTRERQGRAIQQPVAGGRTQKSLASSIKVFVAPIETKRVRYFFEGGGCLPANVVGEA